MARKPIEFDLQKVESLAAQGLTEGQIAHFLGVCQDTITNHKKRNSEFSEAIKRGQAKGIGLVTNRLMDQIKEGNTTAMLFYLKCRAGWKEAKEIEISGKDGKDLQSPIIMIQAPEEDAAD